MTFTTTSKELGEALNILSRVINSNATLPILGSISFSVKKKSLTLKASDSEVMLTTSIDLAGADGEGQFCVFAKDIAEAVKNIGDKPLMFELQDTNMVKIDYFSGEFSLPVYLEDLPQMAQMAAEVRQVVLHEALLRTVIERALPATADDDLRPVMNGVYFNLTTDALEVVASNGHKLVKNTVAAVKAVSDADIASFIMPKKPATILKNILRNDAEKTVTITSDDRQGTVVMDGYTLQFRLIEGRYPNYNSVMPKDNDKTVTVDRQTFLAALKRVVPFANNSSCLVKVTVDDNKAVLSAEDYDFSKNATESVTCAYDDEKMSIGFKGTTLGELLSLLKTENVELQLKDPSRAALIVPTEQDADSEVTMLLMPILIND